MKTHVATVKVWLLAIALPLSLLGVTKFIATKAQDSASEKSEWKVKRVGPRSMRNKGKKSDYLDSERIIEDQIPTGVPIAIEIRNLKTNSLLRDVEVKVTNASEKPIYFLELGFVLPDNLSPDGYPINFPLRYGRSELIKFENPLESNDIPLQPGESFVFKIPENNLKGFEGLVAKGKINRAEIKRVFLMFHQLNFGDKTGFSGGGSPVPISVKRAQQMNAMKRMT